MDIVEKITYWVELSDYDFKTAEVMQETKRFLYVGFMCHQVIEKILKAIYVANKKSTPPYTHNLTLLAKDAGIYNGLSDEQKDFISNKGIPTMDKIEVITKVKKYAEIVRKTFPVRMVILFGSYAKDCGREYSDIDVAVVVDHNDRDYLESRQQLFKLGTDIDCRIEPVLIERDQKDPSGFFEEILNTGEIVYQSSGI
ncbi:MAG: HEPN domain-containing protein [bacterium]|nr:HEPN domain-containing protein [bacterium]